MHVISRSALKECWEKHPNAEQPLKVWYSRVKKAQWRSFHDVKNDFPSADQVGDHRVVFNIKGNDYRLVAVVFMTTSKLYIRFVGTHAEYNKIDALII